MFSQPASREHVLDQEQQRFPILSDTIRRAQQGDRSAFEQLYREHTARVYALCLRIAGDGNRAEELTQDVFVRVWEVLGSFRGESAFSSWLHRVTVNTVLVNFRSDKRRMARVFGTGELETFDKPEHSLQPGSLIDLEDAIAALPPQARTIFVLHDIEGYRHEEIAEQLGLATGTCKAQLHRARKLLREALAL